jgi:hypothetical protein
VCHSHRHQPCFRLAYRHDYWVHFLLLLSCFPPIPQPVHEVYLGDQNTMQKVIRTLVFAPSGEFVNRAAKKGDTVLVETETTIRAYSMTDSIPLIKAGLTVCKVNNKA